LEALVGVFFSNINSKSQCEVLPPHKSMLSITLDAEWENKEYGNITKHVILPGLEMESMASAIA
jgi:hypothetical protein